MRGTVKFFNEQKGFGFILAEDDKEYFVHISGVEHGTILRDSDNVEFEVVQGDKGPKADQVKLDN